MSMLTLIDVDLLRFLMNRRRQYEVRMFPKVTDGFEGRIFEMGYNKINGNAVFSRKKNEASRTHQETALPLSYAEPTRFNSSPIDRPACTLRGVVL